jgi:hypothetical protein
MTAGYHPDDQSEHDELDVLVDKFRKRFEGIMGNTDREYGSFYRMRKANIF